MTIAEHPHVATLLQEITYYKEKYEQEVQQTAYLRSKIEEIEADYEAANREHSYLQGKLETMDTAQTWRSNVDRIPGEVLTPSRKASIITLRTHLKEHAASRNVDGYLLVRLNELAGPQKEGALGDNINYVSTVHQNDKYSGESQPDLPAIIPLFDKKLIWVKDDSMPRGWRQDAYLKALDLLEHPELWEEACSTLNPWGGADRDQGRPKKCERCHRPLEEKDTVISRQRETYCKRCKIKHVYPERLVNAPQIPTDDLPPDDPEGAKNQLDFQVSTGEEANKQLDGVITFPLHHQVDFQTSNEEQGAKNQVDFSTPEQDEPITRPPTLAIGEYPLGDFSLEDMLRKRIGHGPVIYSTGILDQSKKYLHKPAGYTPNIAASIRGDLQHIYGSRPAFPDGTTYLLGFDGDTPELDAHRLEWMTQLATAGIPSVCWLRRPGRWHLEVYTDKAVDSRAFYAYVTEACPGLLTVPECFPIDAPGGVDRADFPYSWPLYYRIGNQVIECAAEVMLAGDTVPMVSLGIQSDRKRLEWLISQAIIPAERIPALPLEEETRNAASQGGALLDIPSPIRSVPFDDGLGRLLIANWNAGHIWEDIAEVRGGRFCATWRKERTPSVIINDDGSAHDFGKTGYYPKHFDKFEAYCLINGLDKGEQVKRLIAAFQAKERVEVAS